jgi:hypothetical protein
MKTYKSFVDNKIISQPINEEIGLFDAIKNLFSKLLGSISEELKKPVMDLTNKLDKTKNADEMKKIITDYLKIHRDGLAKFMNEADSLSTLVKATNDNLTAIYACIDTSIKHLGDQKYSFDEMFKNAPQGLKKLFSGDEKNFNKNVGVFGKQLVTDIGKQFKITSQEIETDIELGKNNKDVKILQAQEIKNATITTTTEQKPGEQKTAQTPATGAAPTTQAAPATPTKESLNYTESNLLLEEADSATGVTLDNFKKLKDGIIKWFDMTLYKSIKEELAKQKTAETQTTDSIDNKVNAVTSTQHKDSVKKLLDKIVSLNDNGKYAQVRDFMIKNMGFSEDDFKGVIF